MTDVTIARGIRWKDKQWSTRHYTES